MLAPEPRRVSPAIGLYKASPALELVGETSPSKVRVLLAEPDAACREKFAACLRGNGYEVVTAKTGAETLETLRLSDFDILLADADLPDLRGLDLLRGALALRPEMPFALFAWKANLEMAKAALLGGAADFVTRPFPEEDLLIIAERNLTRQAMQRKKAAANPLALQNSQESVLDTLLTALNGRSTEPPGHAERVAAYTMELSDRARLSPATRLPIERGALLHDIGKIAVPDRILLKPGPLTAEEWAEVRKHPLVGFQMCHPIPMLREAALVVRNHHEKWDGSGYPDGLAGESIPFGARLFALADALDGMTSERVYRKTIGMEAARAEIERRAGTHFDPQLAQIFLTIPLARLEQLRALTDK